MRFGAVWFRRYEYIIYGIYTVFIAKSIHAGKKQSQTLRQRHTHTCTHGRCTHSLENTQPFMPTAPLTLFHIMHPCTHILIQLHESDALMQEGPHTNTQLHAYRYFSCVFVCASTCESSVFKNNTYIMETMAGWCVDAPTNAAKQAMLSLRWQQTYH